MQVACPALTPGRPRLPLQPPILALIWTLIQGSSWTLPTRGPLPSCLEGMEGRTGPTCNTLRTPRHSPPTRVPGTQGGLGVHASSAGRARDRKPVPLAALPTVTGAHRPLLQPHTTPPRPWPQTARPRRPRHPLGVTSTAPGRKQAAACLHPPEPLSYKTLYWGGGGARGSAEHEVLGAEVHRPAQQPLGGDELQRHRLGPLLLQVPLEDLQGADRQTDRRSGTLRALCPAPRRCPRRALTSKAVSSSSGAMLTSGTDSAWLMTLAA